ncbi:MAG: bifunctional DNA-binding transcriptional regulator/O6-methylguanine-DNA methyltransferase Ada [Acidimicrobiaceae bacterium]|nr:bifunctional DNA-binding transcriptional regulator/O6-methylguanine-DNA methyltransferase Ada [Acidimicrobiaceae bacterium]
MPSRYAPRKLGVVHDLDESRWSAVQRRDENLGGTFVYAVVTTGVACQPGCASRTPRRDNVEFFCTLHEAELAGYRACLRCRPGEQRVLDASLEAVISLCRRLERDSASRVATFAAEVGYSESHLRRRFSQVIGVPVATYQRALRAQRAREALGTSMAVTDAAYEAGFGSSRAFYEHSASQLGMSPRHYRSGGEGERIAFTSLVTPLGHVVCARTERGVCAVRIGDDEEALVREVVQEFPRATLERDDAGLGDLASVIALVVRGEGESTLLPLDIQGTAFQIRVWGALRRVPRGTTLTYSQLAELIGSPRAVRAVGSACGANPVALVIPCHRVVRRDGSLGGYRWGLEVKEALLEAEKPRTPS